MFLIWQKFCYPTGITTIQLSDSTCAEVLADRERSGLEDYVECGCPTNDGYRSTGNTAPLIHVVAPALQY